jgi:hypothetical protein
LKACKSTTIELCGGKSGLGLLDSVGFFSQAASQSMEKMSTTGTSFLERRFIVNPPEKGFAKVSYIS